MRRRVWLLMALLSIGFVSAAAFYVLRPSYLVVKNVSAVELRDIEVVVKESNGSRKVHRSLSSLAPGARFKVPHGWNDSAIDIRGVTGETNWQHKQEYVDLWSGEGWKVEVGHAGVVQSGYDY